MKIKRLKNLKGVTCPRCGYAYTDTDTAMIPGLAWGLRGSERCIKCLAPFGIEVNIRVTFDTYTFPPGEDG